MRRIHGLLVIDRNLRGWVLQGQVYVGTYEMARGLEFDTVIIPFASKNNLPPQSDIDAVDLNNAETKWCHYFYIAVTRAKRNLIVTYSGRSLTDLCPKVRPCFGERHGLND